MIEVNGPANIVMLIEAMNESDNAQFQKEILAKILKEAHFTIEYMKKLSNPTGIKYHEIKNPKVAA